MAHTPGPWSVGRTLTTEQTRRWNEGEWAKNEKEECRRVFAYFTARDEGRGREFIAEFHTPENARIGAAAPAMLDALKLVREGEECVCVCRQCGQDKDYHLELAVNAHDYKAPAPCLADIVNAAIKLAEGE